MENIEKLVRERRSVRTYDGNRVAEADLKNLFSFIEKLENPYNIPVEFKLLDGKEQALKCPVVSGTDLFIGAKAPNVPYMEEAIGYAFEALVLYAQSVGLGTVWVGGTMDRAAFQKAIGLEQSERMPCMSPIGYPASKMSLKETVMRKATRADSRNPFETLFYSGDLNTPLKEEKAGELSFPLQMVRWAPSAVNKQPWRVVVTDTAVHFYLKHSKGYVSDAVGDMQKIDMGIALCHFALAAKEKGITVEFSLSDPQIKTEKDTEYIASYILK